MNNKHHTYRHARVEDVRCKCILLDMNNSTVVSAS